LSGKRRADGPAVTKSAPKKKPSGRSRLRKVLMWLLIVGLVGALALVTTGYIVYKNTTIPDPNADFLTETSHIYYSDGKTELGQLAVQQRDSIPYDQMPDCIKDGVVAAENQSFFTDNGIDPKGILRAAFSNAKGNATQGASTITQQYVKILYLTQERSIKRKIKEAFLSLKIHNELSKEQILEGYLNTIYFGRGAYGIQAASHAYFKKDAKNLKLKQCAVLASVVNNPVGLDPANGEAAKAALKERYDYVLSSMAGMGKITATEADTAEQSLPKFPKQAAEDTYGGQRGHALTLIKSQLLKLKDGNGDPLFTEEQITGGGLKITTTLTKKAMDAAEQGVDEIRPDMGKGNKNLHVGVASVEPGTGALRGFYGGQDFLKSQINWAVAGGSPGSSFKPFAVAAGIKAGYSLKDTFDGNSPYQLPDGTDVVNEGEGGGTDYGTVSLLKATEDSINTAFIDMTLGMPDGPQSIMDTAVAMGIPPEKAKPKTTGIPNSSPGLHPETGISLGSMTESPINMANAYATIANDGERANVYVIEKVVDRNGETLYNHKVSNEQAIDPDIDHDVSYAMQQVVENGTGAAAQALGRPAAGKTGTATNGNDQVSSSWFVGFTPQLATAVMYVRGDGNDQLDGWLPDYNGVAGYFGANYPARTWTAVMTKALDGEPVEDFPPPANVDGVAPQEGHAPYTPPPKTTKPPKTSETPSETPSETLSPSPTKTHPTHTGSPSPTDTGTGLPCFPNCPSPSDTPTATSSPSASAAREERYVS
jgi:membrane peptidoglycan carboxypeptidase